MTVRFVRNSLVALLLVACSGSDVTAPDRGRAPPQPTGTTTAIGVDPVTGASVETNQDDYVPGEIVHVVLKGFKPGEDVRLVMSEMPDTHGDVDTTVTVDVDGEWSGHFYDVQVHDLGATFTLTATGLESGSSATVVFTDSQTLTIQSLAPSPPTAGNSFDANLQVVLSDGDDWRETRIRLTRTNPFYGSNPIYDLCFDHSDFTTNGTKALAVTIPASGGAWNGGQSLVPGTYTLGVRGYETNNGCDTDDDFPSSSDVTQTFTVSSVDPDLSITKVANSDPICDTGGGDPDFCVTRPATYTLTITNNGQNATSGTVTVTDTLPASAGDLDDKITFGSGSAGWTCGTTTTVAAPPRDIISCTTSDVAGNGGTKVLTLTVNPQADGSDWTDVVNRAWVVGGGDVSSAVGSAQVDVRQLPDFFVESIVITPQPVALGGTASANVTVRVSGEDWRCMIGRVRTSANAFLAGFSDIQTDFEPDGTTDGTHSRSFNFLVPGIAGTYGLRVRVYTDDDCDEDEEEGFATFNVAAAPANVATTTEVLAAPTPSVFGQSVTFIATVSPASGPAATGAVNFYEFTAGQSCGTLGGAVALASDATAPFTFSTVALSVATHTITACYVPAAGWVSSFDDVAHTVDKADVLVSVSDSPTSSTFGQSVTFTATVTAVAPGAGTPTGTVTFYEFSGGQTCALPGAAVGSSDASAPYEFTTSLLGVGNHTITACYAGSTNHNPNSGSDTHAVSAIGTTTEVLASPSPSVFGQSVTFTATVTPASGGAATGTVNFYEFTAGQSCATLGGAGALASDNSSPFSFSTSSLSRASHTISACYIPNAGWADSNDDVVHVVNKADVTVGVSDSPTSSVAGQSVTFTATVTASAPGAGTPTGTVTFHELTGGQTCAAPGATLGSDGVAPYELTTSSLSVAAHTITACYGGDTNFNSNSGSDTHTVSKAEVTVTVSDAPTSSVWGQSVTFTAAVAAVAPGSGTPTGTVTFYELTGGQTCLAPGAALGSDGTAPFQLVTSSLSVGAHTITACYGGDVNFNPNSGGDAHTVGQASTNVVVTSNTPTTFGNAANFTAAVNVVAPGAGTPTGTVTFYEFGAGQSCASPPATSLGSDASAPYQFSSNALAAGAHTISACYPGDANFLADDGSMVHTVNAVTTTVVASTTTTPQYSDEINLKAVVTPAEVVTSAGTSALTGDVRFYFQAAAVSCPVADPGVGPANGVVGSDDIVDSDNGVAEDTDYQVLNAAGNYVLTACFYSSNSNFGNGGDTDAVTLTTEDATVTPDAGNINSIVSGAGGTPVTSFNLTFLVKETNAEPDANAGALAGNINNVAFGVVLQGVGIPGNNETGACTAPAAGTGYATKTYVCTFSSVAVDAYEVVATVSGSYYDGTTSDALSVYDPNAGFVTGGGKFVFPGTTDKVNFGLVFTNPSKKALRGNLVVIRHMPNGDICRAKSNGLEAPAIVSNAASFAGKGNYSCTRPDGTLYDGSGNLTITGWVQDNGQGSTATGPDKFWVKVSGALNSNLVMPGTSANAAPLTGGNIQVPQPGRP
jgi:hypothetical protein